MIEKNDVNQIVELVFFVLQVDRTSNVAVTHCGLAEATRASRGLRSYIEMLTTELLAACWLPFLSWRTLRRDRKFYRGNLHHLQSALNRIFSSALAHVSYLMQSENSLLLYRVC
jgi:hypothetical protein